MVTPSKRNRRRHLSNKVHGLQINNICSNPSNSRRNETVPVSFKDGSSINTTMSTSISTSSASSALELNMSQNKRIEYHNVTPTFSTLIPQEKMKGISSEEPPLLQPLNYFNMHDSRLNQKENKRRSLQSKNIISSSSPNSRNDPYICTPSYIASRVRTRSSGSSQEHHINKNIQGINVDDVGRNLSSPSKNEQHFKKSRSIQHKGNHHNIQQQEQPDQRKHHEQRLQKMKNKSTYFNDMNHYEEDDDTQFNSVNMQQSSEKSYTLELQNSTKNRNLSCDQINSGGSFDFFQTEDFKQISSSVFQQVSYDIDDDSFSSHQFAKGSESGIRLTSVAAKATIGKGLEDESTVHTNMNKNISNQSNTQYQETCRSRVSGKKDFRINVLRDDCINNSNDDEDSSTTTFTLGVAGAVVGLITMGPVGLLVGAACVGIGIGVMQIPEEERTKVSKKATITFNRMKDSAIAANDALSSSCIAVCSSPQSMSKPGENNEKVEASTNLAPNTINLQRSPTFSPTVSNISGNTGVVPNHLGLLNSDEQNREISRQNTLQTNTYPSTRVAPACRRRTQRITPVSQIHSLDPSLHPRAWLEIMASAWTSHDDKNEAMEEILILSKDKIHAKMLLEEGILDSLMYIILSFFKSYCPGRIPVETFMADPFYFHSKLAASCCVALGKAHWAIAYAEADKSYNHGCTHVPIERQVAQMLLEIPHHVISWSESDDREEIFKLTTDMENDTAQQLAKSVGALADGRVEISIINI